MQKKVCQGTVETSVTYCTNEVPDVSFQAPSLPLLLMEEARMDRPISPSKLSTTLLSLNLRFPPAPMLTPWKLTL